MTFSQHKGAVIAVLMVMLSGCVTMNSPDSKLYTLSSVANDATSMSNQSATLPVLAVGPVDLPDYLRRPQIVSREGDNRIHVAEFDRWAAPLNEQVERVLAEDLGARVHELVVINYREQRFKPTYRLTMSLERFERQDADEVKLAGRWTLSKADSGAVLMTRRDNLSVPVKGAGYEAAVAAQSEALKLLAGNVSDALEKYLSHSPSDR